MFEALNHHQLEKLAPSIFGAGGSDKTSDKYSHISTVQVIDAIAREGFLPVYAGQSRSRLPGKIDFAKHVIRFRHQDSIATNSGLHPELVLTNSHDGLSSYKLQSGLFRMVCSNGMVTGETFRQVNVRHTGDVIGNVIEGVYEIVQESEKILDAAESMRALELTTDERQVFAKSVHQLYFGDEESNNRTAITPEKFLRVRRGADRGQDLFTTLNITQENVIRGGLSGYYIDEHKQYRKTSTRAIASIDRNNTLNRALWTLAEEMAKLKGAA